MSDDTIYTAVSRPGPVEREILAALAPTVRVRRRVAAGVALRTLETLADRPARPTVLLVHGRGHAASVWAPWLTALGSRERVVAVDLPGFGHSGAAPLCDPSAAGALAWFAEPVERVAIEEGPVVLVGHSLGGLVALSIALGRRADVRALILIGSMGLSPVILPKARLYLRAGPERLARLGALFGRGGRGGPIDRLRRELYLVRGGRPQPSAAFDRLVPLMGPGYNLAHRLSELAVPTLLVWGERDDAFPVPVAMQAAAHIPGAELLVLSAGHSPHLEMPEACLEHVARLLDKLPVSGGGE